MKLLVVDVERELPEVPPSQVGEAWVLVRLHGHPMGLLQADRRGWSAAELRDQITRELSTRILEHLAGDAIGQRSTIGGRLRDDCPRYADVELPSITVAVCTRNGAERLPSCLRALDALRYPASRIERLVIDNAPADDRTRAVVSSHSTFRYIVEPRPGLDWARNRAVLEASGDIIAFTDDDVEVDAGWALALARTFASDAAVDVVTGLVVPDEIDHDAQRLFEAYGGFGRGFNRLYYKAAPQSPQAMDLGGAGAFGTGANMAFRRSMFSRIGLFDPALDVGTPTNGGGDLEMFFRALKEGGTLVYEPAAIVRHRHRTRYEDLKVQLTNNGVGFYSYLVRTACHYRDERLALAHLGVWWFFWWNIRRWLRSFTHPHEFPRELIVAELRGSFAGLTRYFVARRHAAETALKFGPQPPLSETSR